MSKNEDYILQLCRVYHGEQINPYCVKTGEKFDKWKYLKRHIWDVEYAVCTGYDIWRKLYKSHYPNSEYSGEQLIEEIYKYAIKTKLTKMETPNIDYEKMYFQL